MFLVPIGYGKSAVVAPPRRGLDELIQSERYDMGKFRSDAQMMGFVTTKTLQGAYGRRGGADGDEKN